VLAIILALPIYGIYHYFSNHLREEKDKRQQAENNRSLLQTIVVNLKNSNDSYRQLIDDIRRDINRSNFDSTEKRRLLSIIEVKETQINAITKKHEKDIADIKAMYEAKLRKKDLTVDSITKFFNEKMAALSQQNDSLFKAIKATNPKDTASPKIGVAQSSVMPIGARLTIATFRNRNINSNEELTTTDVAANIRQVRVNFQLDRSFQNNDSIYVQLRNTRWQGSENVNRNRLSNNNNGYVDFIIPQNSLSKGRLIAEIYNGNNLIQTESIALQ
jgi:hypothetical protein